MKLLSYSHPVRRFFIGSFFVFVFLSNIILTTPVARADIWGAAFGAAFFSNVLDLIKTQLKSALLGTLKVAATEMINSKVGQMVGGSTAGNARFVTDWNQFLYEKPAAEVDLYMNDFFSQITLGKNAQANYAGIGDTGSNVGGSYASYLTQTAQASMGSEANEAYPTFNIDEYGSNVEQIFSKGNFLGVDAFFTNPANNPIGLSLMAERKYQKELTKRVETLKTQQQSSGYIPPTDKNGTVIAPVATLEGMQKDAMNIGNTIIATATEPGQFLAGVVGAVVNKAITNMVQRGVGKIQASIKKEIRTYDAKITKELNRADKKLGPAAKYLKDVSQRTDTKIKPYTQAPPPAVDCVDRSAGAC